MKTSKAVENLDSLANHFEFRDWDYTRVDHIKSIRYDSDHDYTNKFSYRFKKSMWWLFAPRPDWLKMLDGRKMGPLRSIRDRVGMARYALKRDPNTPDGVLDSGNVIVYWEETGEYLSLMQPTVGALLANFLKEEPEHPHAKLIIKELERLDKRLKKRWKDGEVEGKSNTEHE